MSNNSFEEIEYKFIVKNIPLDDLINPVNIMQYYIKENNINFIFLSKDDEKYHININDNFNSLIKLYIPNKKAEKLLDLGLVNYKENNKLMFKKSECTLRVRESNDEYVFCIKGIKVGNSSPEIEFPITKEDNDAIINNTYIVIDNPIYKTRYHYEHEGFMFEIDVFKGRLEGLIIAEVEVDNKNIIVDKFPDDWILEITDDPKYFNSNLAKI